MNRIQTRGSTLESSPKKPDGNHLERTIQRSWGSTLESSPSKEADGTSLGPPQNQLHSRRTSPVTAPLYDSSHGRIWEAIGGLGLWGRYGLSEAFWKHFSF